ncbi:MAG TPA: TIR domain-containing protein [Planctomycetaceae bacterium]|jgi:hypothetical protein|nr:TIR domain-containing protein [Planctomycetaceae bacterium]
MTARKFRSGIFVSYSHADHEWLELLQRHLAPYVFGEKLVLWDDTKIAPGADWVQEITNALDQARVAVLLVTPNFLASSFVMQVELPAILQRAGRDLTITWIPIRAAAYQATPLGQFQAAHDPSTPIASLPQAKQDVAMVSIAKMIAAAAGINAFANSLGIIDAFEPQVSAFVSGTPEPEEPVTHSWRAEQVEASIQLVDPGRTQTLVTAEELEEFDPDALKLIRAYERTMKDLFERWTELKPKRVALDHQIRLEARKESDEVRHELCGELNELLRFIESMGKSLQDHYRHVRYICSQPTA